MSARVRAPVGAGARARACVCLCVCVNKTQVSFPEVRLFELPLKYGAFPSPAKEFINRSREMIFLRDGPDNESPIPVKFFSNKYAPELSWSLVF